MNEAEGELRSRRWVDALAQQRPPWTFGECLVRAINFWLEE